MIDRLRRLRITPEAVVITCVALANVVFHLLLPEYGYHRDEMYYVAIADGFSFANLDMPPGAPLYLKLFLMLFGHSLKVVHLAASVCGSMVIIFAGLIAKEFGGKAYAMLLTGICLIFSGLAIFGSLYTYDGVSFAVWAGVFYLIVRMLKGGSQRLWLVAGVLLGIGMMTKLTILFLGLAIFICLWLVKERKWFGSPWIWAGALIAWLGVLPYALWQKSHGWYFLSYASTYSQRVTHDSPVLAFVWDQVLPNNIALVPVWLIGLVVLLFSRMWSQFRFFGFVYLVLCIAVFWVGGQFYFMMPVYSVLVAAGAVWIEQRLKSKTTPEHPRLAAKIAVPAAYVLLAAPSLPFFVPVLPVNTLIRYLKPVGVTAGVKTEDSQVRDLPQHIADRFGWEDMARIVARVYHQAQDTSAVLVGVAAGDWGEASALHVYGREFGMPEPISTDGWFYFDALQRNDFRKSYIVIGNSPAQLQSLFAQVERKAVFTNPYCRPNEDNSPVFLCSRPKVSLRAYWIVVHRMDPGFEELLRGRGVDQAAAYYHRRREQDSTALLFTEPEMNRLGYDYLARGKVREALEVFRLNVEAYPESFNVYDSYGEALMRDHQYELAVRNYARSMELNPENDNARKKLAELRPLLHR